MSGTTATIVLGHSQTLFRTALADALREEPRHMVVAEAGDPRATLDAVERVRPDLVILDADLGARRGGVSVCAAITGGAPGGADAVARGLTGDAFDTDLTAGGDAFGTAPRVLVLADSPSDEDLIAALKAGACGYALISGGLDELALTIQAALRGEACVPRRMLGGLLRALIDERRVEDAVRERWERLSRREREVLELLTEGLGNDEIAKRLVISPETARTHVQNVMTKLEVHSRVEAATLALDHGLVEEPSVVRIR